MKLYILSTILFIFAASSASAEAEGRVTHPLPGDPLIDFQIDRCEATSGFARAWYFTNAGMVIALSDLCIDETKGVVNSIEYRDGFTLVSKSKKGKILEDLDSSDAQALRTNVRFTTEYLEGCEPDGFFVSYHQFVENNGFHIHDAHGAYLFGYTIPSTSNKPMKLETEAVLLQLGFFSQVQVPQKTTETLPDVGVFLGKFAISEDTGVFTITEGGGNSVGDAGGSIQITIGPDGKVEMSGKITAKNQRLAGHKPGEWISMSAEILSMRGHLLGEAGNQLRGFGIMQGSFVDTDGQTHQFRAAADFQSCLNMDKW